MVGLKLFGKNEWGVRFFNAAAFFLSVLAVAFMGVILWGRKTGLVAGLIYVSSPFPVFAASSVSADTWLNLWVICAVLCYAKVEFDIPLRNEQRWIFLMWVLWGLAFLTKGTSSILLFFPVVLWHFLFSSQEKKRKLFHPGGIFLFLVIGLSWYVAVSARNPGLLSYWINSEVLARVSPDFSFRNFQWYMPFLIYLPVLLLGGGIWTYLEYQIIRKKFLPVLTRIGSYLSAGRPALFLVLWLFIPLGIFFLVKSRLPLYVLPLYVPVVLTLARASEVFLVPSWTLRKVCTIAVLSGFFLVTARGVAFLSPPSTI